MGFTRLTPSKPTIAAISGFAWRAASSSRCGATCGSPPRAPRFGYPERRWGVPLIDGGTQRLPRIVGLGRALDLILTGRMIDAAGGPRDGPAHRGRRRPATHLERALALAEGLARFPQRTMLADRRAAIEGLGMTLADGARAGGRGRTGGVRGRRARRGALRRGRGSRGRGRGRLAARRAGAARLAPTDRTGCIAGRLSRMAYFVTGATGFIGRRLVERLLENRQGKIYVLVRESSKARLDDLIERWSIVVGPSAAERIVPVVGRPAQAAAGGREGAGRTSCAARSTTSSTSPPSTT